MAENKRHKGHRQRMRERVQSYGLDSLAEHEALEYVLYLTNAQKDTNGIAHDLIDRFGDFAAVLEASEEELCTVEGVGPSTARMLHLLPQISRYYGRSRTSTTRCIKTTEQMGSYLMAKLRGRTTSAPCWSVWTAASGCAPPSGCGRAPPTGSVWISKMW